jgi:NADH dehydrogenase [ubiquinone] 1 alpha subcomplex assembly factor 7
MSTPLTASLQRRIALTGPITIADFMTEALLHPVHGYYRRAHAIGTSGDFVTAPEVSQMFGELIGAWLAERWMALGQPDVVRLVELGPGRGTLMADALRATRAVRGLQPALRLHLVEIDPTLRALQQRLLDRSLAHVAWHEHVDDVPDDAPLLLVANEFFDAMPVRQLVRTSAGWSERMVGLHAGATSGQDIFGYAVAPGGTPLVALLDAAVRDGAGVDAVAEVSPAAVALMRTLAERIVRNRGAALIVDYGYDAGSHGDTLQAMHRHTKVGVFDRIGDSDLTAHVDFAALVRTAREAGAVVRGPVGQGAFLRALGIEARARALLSQATPQQASTIGTGMARLIAPDQMGTLFRVLAVHDRTSAAAPGFPPVEAPESSSRGSRP